MDPLSFSWQSTIQSIDQYSAKEINEFCSYSQISKVYLRLIEQKDIPEIYKFRHTAWLRSCLASFYDNAENEEIFKFWSMSMNQILYFLRTSTGLDQENLDLLAMGKYGSNVLNLSSDIDILLVAEGPIENILPKTRKFLNLINTKSEWGFLSRTDLNLKPTVLINNYIINPSMLINYLWESKELWERLAYTRLRPIFTGIQNSKQEDYLGQIKKFCFQKYVNMSLLEGLAELTKKILNHNLDDDNLKLCAGGIRSIELFLSSVQLLYGGRDLDLQTSDTYELFRLIKNKHYIKIHNLEDLRENYDQLRRAENLIQMQTDSQDHSLNSQFPLDKKQIKRICEHNVEILRNFMNATVSSGVNKSPTPAKNENLNLDTGKFPHLKDFESFLVKRPSYQRLILSHPEAYENFINALKYSPYLTRILVLRPDLFDLYLIKKTIIDQKEEDEFFLNQLVDFKLLSFITGVGDFITHLNVDTFTKGLSLTTDKCIELLIQKVFPENNPLQILKLGKWASHEVGLKSDLDFIFVCEDSSVDVKKIRKIIHYIGHHTFYGPFYDIDLRLRPSGNAGPIVTTKEQLRNYVENPATAAWIKQSYLRNAFLGSQTKMRFEIPTPWLNPEQIEELKEIRQKRLLSLNNTKLSAKETQGGLIDLEFFTQHLCLVNNYFPEKNSFHEIVLELYQNNFISDFLQQELIRIYRYLRTVEQICSLKSANEDPVVTADNEGFLFDLPENAVKNMNAALSYNLGFESLKSVLNDSQKLIEKHHPFLL